jgi:hypothetical protein
MARHACLSLFRRLRSSRPPTPGALILLAALLLAVATASPADAALPTTTHAWWDLESSATPTNLPPGGEGEIILKATNLGDETIDATADPVAITAELPAALEASATAISPTVRLGPGGMTGTLTCALASLSCTFDGTLAPYRSLEITIAMKEVEPNAASGEDGEVTVTGGGVPPASLRRPIMVSSTPAPFGIENYELSPEAEEGSVDSQAGSHPFQMTTTLALNRVPVIRAGKLVPGEAGLVKDLDFKWPPGLIGNPSASPRCSALQFGQAACPQDSAVGVATVTGYEPTNLGLMEFTVPLYNVEPEAGEPARFAFNFNLGTNATFVFIDPSVRSGGDYGVAVSVKNTTESLELLSSVVTVWGTPGDPRHDQSRGSCVETAPEEPCALPDGPAPRPFLRLPTSCTLSLRNSVEANSWLDPAAFLEADDPGATPGGCSQVPFTPTIEARPTTTAPDSPSGLHFDLHNPQVEAPEALGEADLRDATVGLPAGLAVNPASANGLGACSEAEVGYEGLKEGRQSFSAAPARCPDSSKIGTVEVDTPLLDHPLPGAVYLAEQEENPFHSLLALYITVYDPISGVVVKLPVAVSPDPATGQLTTTVTDSPQLPFEDLRLDLFEGPQAPLRTPAACGSFITTTALTPWTAPASGAPASPTDSFRVGGSCAPSAAQEPNAPSIQAGTTNPQAGAYSPFALKLSREDGSQELTGIDATLPPGLIGRLAGVPYCPDADIAAARGKTGKAEQAAPSCPSASEVGTVDAGAGAGPDPFYVKGHAYLAGPYKGAPVSLAIVTPAVAGPFDLGTVVVRTALYVDPVTTQITAKSDPIPAILDGIPLDLRSIALSISRNQFTLNPTNCEPMSVDGTATSILGQGAALIKPFQVGGCEALAFKPNLELQLNGATKRIGHPALKAVLTYPQGGGYANVARAQVNLPHGEFLDQGNLNKTCTKPVLLAGNCPASSVYGHAKAWTPLLDAPLEGPVYLVGGYGYKLPALVAELDGQIRVLLVGKVDSGKNKGIRSTFEVVPDAPVEKFVLEMKGGPKYGLLENSENLCTASKANRRAIARFTGQNGKVEAFKPLVKNQCKKAKKKQPKHHKSHR